MSVQRRNAPSRSHRRKYDLFRRGLLIAAGCCFWRAFCVSVPPACRHIIAILMCVSALGSAAAFFPEQESRFPQRQFGIAVWASPPLCGPAIAPHHYSSGSLHSVRRSLCADFRTGKPISHGVRGSGVVPASGLLKVALGFETPTPDALTLCCFGLDGLCGCGRGLNVMGSSKPNISHQRVGALQSYICWRRPIGLLSIVPTCFADTARGDESTLHELITFSSVKAIRKPSLSMIAESASTMPNCFIILRLCFLLRMQFVVNVLRSVTQVLGFTTPPRCD